MRSPRCLYHASFQQFLEESSPQVLGKIVMSFHGSDQTTTKEAWEGEIKILQQVLQQWGNEDAHIIFEYDIPRLGKRIDVVLLIRGIIICLEFKVGKKEALQGDLEQVLDYALDLNNFHKFSYNKPIVPVLIPTEYNSASSLLQSSAYDDAVYNPVITGAKQLQNTLETIISSAQTEIIQEEWGEKWIISPYAPTPTIVEAARSLYENHTVENIVRHEADGVSTDATIDYILDVIEQSKPRNGEKVGKKSICFVTGVPGAGKTLVGLEVAIKQSFQEGQKKEEDGAVYLSGNGPLVAVLTEALAIDNHKKNKGKTLSASRREVSKSIQIIHRYRDNMLAKIKTPIENGVLEIDPNKAVKEEKTGYGEVEHVAIFDEAQRSWTQARIANYLKRGGTYGNKLKVADFPMSEASFLIWSLDQREDWAVIVCLVGGGQEINTGEAGISEWIDALNTRFRHWNIFISSKLTQPEYAEGRVNELLQKNSNVTFSDKLHLAVSLRSFRAETLSDFVHSFLSFSPDARDLYQDVCAKNYPFYLTRDINKARAWLRSKSRGTQQTGILVTKVAARFKPQAVNVLAQGDENAVHWFLEDKKDIRSSNYLEEAATEIQVQGLEVDYACVLWDADMRCEDGKWGYYKFNGKTKWNPENNTDNRKYMLNAYRVLMTRARQGIVICVPEGNHRLNAEGFPEDPTRLPEFYDSTYEYFKGIGVKEL